MRAVALGLMLLLAGCGTATQTHQGLVASGQALIGVGNTFVQVGQIYEANCKPAVKFPSLVKFCAGFKDFAPRFQTAYPLAVDAWQIARKNNDLSAQADATAVVLSLSTDLTALAVQVLATVQ